MAPIPMFSPVSGCKAKTSSILRLAAEVPFIGPHCVPLVPNSTQDSSDRSTCGVMLSHA